MHWCTDWHTGRQVIAPFISPIVTSVFTLCDIGFYTLWYSFFIETIVFTYHKISCLLMRESIKTNGTILMYNSFQIDHPRSRNQCTVEQTDIQADKLLITSSYLLWHLLLPFVTLVSTYCDTHVFHCDNSLYERLTYRQTSYCSLHLTYCDACFHPLWHWFLNIVVSIFHCDISFYRLINRITYMQTSNVSLHLTYCDICWCPLWHWFLHIVAFIVSLWQ